jgi:cytochrome b
MQECADRMNAFLVTYPDEAQHVLSRFVEYQHELVEIHEGFQRRRRLERGELPLDDDDDASHPPVGAPVIAIMSAILQTHVGNGWFIRPVHLDEDEAS